MAPLFARHGIEFRLDILQEKRDLWSGVGLPELSKSDGKRADAEPRVDSAAEDTSPAGVLSSLDAALDRLENHVLEVN